MVEPAFDIERLIKGGGKLHIWGERCVERLHHNTKPLSQIRRANRVFLFYGNENGSLAVVARVMKLFGFRPLNLGDVPNGYKATRFPLDDGPSKRFKRAVRAPGIDIEPPVSRIYGARRNRCATCGNAIGNGGRGNAGFR